jgi:hypothetical protein
MHKKIKLSSWFLITFVSLFSQLIFVPKASAQGTSRAQLELRRDIATTVFWGLGGAVIGLSTLTFYGRPEEHINNIYAGFGIGLAAGLMAVTERSNQVGELENKPNQKQKFIDQDFVLENKIAVMGPPPLVQLGFSFQ